MLNLNYTEEPDAFETQSEREMEKALEEENDRLHLGKEMLRYAILRNLAKYFSKCKFIRDIQVYDRRLQFYILSKYTYRVSDWYQKSKLVYKYNLRLYSYNMGEGYIVEIC